MIRTSLSGSLAALLAVTLLTASASPVGAEPRALKRTVKAGETAAKLAKRYYGKPWAARVLLLANGLDGLAKRPPELKVGQTVRMPTAWSYRVRPGDTFAGLARDYLGDARKARFLAWINGKAVRRLAPMGHVLIFPAVVRVKPPKRMTLKKLAARLLDRKPRTEAVRRLVRRIRKYNDLKGEPKGRAFVLPLIRLRVLGWFMPSGLPRVDPGTVRRARAAVRQATADLRTGRYLEVVVKLAPMAQTSSLSEALRVRIHHLRCTAFVALARPQAALAAARAVLAVDPGFKLDPVMLSPKVRAVYKRAGKRSGN